MREVGKERHIQEELCKLLPCVCIHRDSEKHLHLLVWDEEKDRPQN